MGFKNGILTFDERSNEMEILGNDYRYTINEDGNTYFEKYIKNLRSHIFVFSPLVFITATTMVLLNYFAYSGRKKGYIFGIIFGSISFIWLFVITGLKGTSILRHSIKEISITGETVTFNCSRALTDREYCFQTSKNLISFEESGKEKIFMNKEFLIFKLENNVKLYFMPSFWDNKQEILDLLNAGNVS